MPADLALRVTVAQVQAGPEQFGDSTGKTYSAAGSRRRHLLAARQQVLQTLLVPGVLELVVRRPAVVDHGAVVVEPQDGLGHGAAAGRVDDVSGSLGADHGVQPGRVSTHPPAGLIEHHPVGLTHGLPDGLVDRFAAGRGPQNGVGAAPAAEVDAKQAVQAADHLAVGEPALL